jgi:hypothetical protein
VVGFGEAFLHRTTGLEARDERGGEATVELWRAALLTRKEKTISASIFEQDSMERRPEEN